jgi:hypothetical protein
VLLLPVAARQDASVRARWRLILVLALPLLGLYAALPTLSALPAVRAWIAARAARAMGSDLQFDGLRINYDLSATLSGVSIAQPGQPPFLTAEHVQVGIRPFGLLSGRALRVRIEKPHVHMATLPSGGGSTSGAPPVALERAEIVDLFVHPSADDSIVPIGPLSMAVDSALGAPGALTLTGGGPLPGDSGTLSWSAAIGSTLATSHGSLSLESNAPLDAVRPWVELSVPAPLSPSAAALRLDWKGTEAGRVAVTADLGWQLPAAPDRLQLSGTGEIDPSDSSAHLKLTGAPLVLRSDDATRAASGVKSQLDVVARPRAKSGVRVDFELGVPAGELLWDRFYIDLAHHHVALRGRLETDAAAVLLTGGALAIDGLGTAKVEGSYDIAGQQERWKSTFEVPGLAAAYDVAVREPLQADYPVLGRVTLRGRVAGAIEQDRAPSGARRLSGFVDLADVALSATDPHLVIAGLDAHLPIDLREDASAAGPVQSGLLRVRGLSVADVVIGDVALPLKVEPNRIAVAEPVRIPLFGGGLEIAQLRAVNLTQAPQASLSLALRDLDLAEAARDFSWPPLQGRVAGEIPALTVDRDAVHSEGEIRIDVFDGNVKMRNLRVDEPFSRVPTVRLDVDIAGLRLDELTATFEVGRISGVVDGGARDLEIANGQPARFDAWMETVARAGVPQRISVTAIRQLSILGGAGGDPLSMGVLSFFDEYRYAKMGFRCHLENDQFTLEGVEKHDGAEYLVVGTTLPPRVNVISHTRVISFSELVQRLSRVLALKAGAPQVNDTP